MPTCSSDTLTNVLPHRNAMPQTQDTTPHPVTVYRHGANLSLCYPSMWNVTLEYTATHFNVLGETRPGNPSPTFHTHQRTFNLMLSWWSTVGSSVECTVPTGSWTRDLWCANPVRYPLAHSDFQWPIVRALVGVNSLMKLSQRSCPLEKKGLSIITSHRICTYHNYIERWMPRVTSVSTAVWSRWSDAAI